MMDDYQAIVSACLAVFLAVYAVRWYNDPLRAIPTVGGSSLPGLSYLGALRIQGDCRGVLEAAYRKHAGSVFKVAFLDRWIVTVAGRNMVEELGKRADELSGPLGSHEFLQMKHLFEPSVLVDDYHVGAIREMGRRELSAVVPPVIDEVCAAVKDCIVADEDEWTGVEITPAMQKIVARASSRAIVGLPLCRNDEYLSLAVNFTLGFIKSGAILRFLPSFLKPVVALFVNFPRRDTRRAVAYIRATIAERQRAASELGKGWNDKPNDLLQSLLDMATAKNESTFTIVQRLLLVNFTAIHTTSMTITHALYHLAEKPAEFIAPLREEIEAAVSADGWTATALGKMWKLDSVLRETLRLYGVGVFSMGRKAIKDVTLSDGTRIPEGTLVNALSYALHRDDAFLEDAHTFDPFRFARMRAAEGGGAKQQCTSTSPEYIAFGHGPYSCPGRYFAAHEMKAVLAHIIVNFDVKLDGDGTRPPNVYFATGVVPAPHGRVLFKKRRWASESI